MGTLKEIRLQSEMTQGELSKRTGIHQTTICGYEAGNIQPKLEDIMAIDKAFKQHVEWPETYSPEIKDEINILLQYYPVSTVINFCARWLREDINYGANMIKHYAYVTSKGMEPLEPMFPNDIDEE